ncbi:YceI family protein [Flavobacterium sp.]|uniref:YceI family protein n=1 Tax=Flavobacterium sp. TaxID=239 RepID=UPI003527DF79
MKKIVLFAFALSIFTISCKKEKETEKPTTVTEETAAATTSLSIVNDSTKVGWVAYKTTDKTPVKGSFKQITLENTQSGTTPQEILEGATFSIPVSSVFTNDETRDGKLKDFFFGALKNTELISGKIHFTDGVPVLAITLNGETREVIVNGSFNNNIYMFDGTINLDDFLAQNAVASLNKVCFDLHKGADGVSKTWSEVAINGSVLFQ